MNEIVIGSQKKINIFCDLLPRRIILKLMNTSSFELQTDEFTLARARKGDIKAREQLYRTYSSPVYTLAYRICASSADAQDVTQDTFIEAFNKLHQYRGDAPFWAWLRRIAVNITLMRLRREKKLFEPVSNEQGFIEIAVTNEQPSNLYDLEQLLSQLSPSARTVVWLHDIEGYTHVEIADLLGKTPSFSKSQLARAYEKLRSKFKWITTDQSSTPIPKRC